MIFSMQSLLSDDQAITATAVSTNVVDLGARGTPYGAAAAVTGDMGKGTPIPVLVQVTEAFATLTSLTITVETSANSDLTSSTVLATETVLAASLTAGKQTFLSFLPKGLTGRYVGLRYTVNGVNATAGKITAGITMGNQTNITGG